MLSKLESEILEKAILKKAIHIENLSNKMRESPEEYLNVEQNLSSRDKASISKHFQKKLKFYYSQQNTKWIAWPAKQASSTKKSRSTNHGKKQRKRRNFVQKLADKAVKQNIVIPLVDFEVPAGAIVLLSRGLGFVKTPYFNPLDVQLDIRSAGNNILSAADKIHLSPTSGEPRTNTIPPKLKNRTYFKSKPSSDPVVNSLVENMESDLTGILRHKAVHVKKKKSNISKAEEDGFKWLKKNVKEGNIVICEADKGGAILIVPPTLIEGKVSEKLLDKSLYSGLPKDPSLQLFDELFDLWKSGCDAGFVSPREAYNVMGVTEPDPDTGSLGGKKSTASRYRPGIPYFYPMLKIHKLSPDQLKPGCNPPARLVTALNEGVCKRSDVFIAKNYLKEVEKLYCGDLLKSTTDALLWLETLNDSYSSARKKSYKCFTFDFASLYDSLSPALVLKAVRLAVVKTYPDWDESKVNWLCSLVELSIRSSVGCFKGKWYRQQKGIPTGGSICVELANIAVYYVLNEVLYSDPGMMKDIESLKRFVDDCTGVFVGPERVFRLWEKSVREKLLAFGLQTDDFVVMKSGNPLPFLDIQFWFDKDTGQLQTDLYRKPTDSPSFLNFSSHHPNHTFSSIVYSQSIRYRRIINSDNRLSERLSNLSETFLECGYPKKMVDNIVKKVKGFSRNIVPKNPVTTSAEVVPIRVVSTYGANDFLESTLTKYENLLKESFSFCALGTQENLFNHVHRTAPKLGNLLSSTKELVIGNGPGPTIPCGSNRCDTCSLVTNSASVSYKGKDVESKNGSCISRNIIYFVTCLICLKGYVGKTVSCLRTRVNGHRALYYRVLVDPIKTVIDNLHTENKYNNDLSLGYHLHKEHNCKNREDFNKYFKFTIIQHCGPSSLDVTEHKWIHRLKTLEPGGINSANPFGIPLIQ